MPTPTPGPGEVRLKVAVSGINPGDTKKRENFFGYGMAYPHVVPHSSEIARAHELIEKPAKRGRVVVVL